MKLKELSPWDKSYDQYRQRIKKQRHYYADKDLYNQSYDFSSSFVWVWEMDHKGWELKNWCFWTVCVSCSVLSHSATPGTLARQASLSMGFSRQEYWSGLPFPSPGDLPNPGIEPVSPALAGRFFTTEPLGKPKEYSRTCENMKFRFLPINSFTGHSHAHVSVSCLWPLSWFNSRVEYLESRDYMAHKTKNIYHLAFYRKSVLMQSQVWLSGAALIIFP